LLLNTHAHGHVLSNRGQLLTDRIVERIGYVETLEGGTGLTGIDAGAPEEALSNRLGVCVIQYDSSVVAAPFNVDALERLSI